jgi:hypothetical protein
VNRRDQRGVVDGGGAQRKSGEGSHQLMINASAGAEQFTAMNARIVRKQTVCVSQQRHQR